MKLPAQLALVLVSAALLPLCFPPFGWWPLIFGVYPALLLATTNTTPRRAFYLGMLQAMLGYVATLYWLFHIFAGATIPLLAIFAVFSALFCGLLNSLAKRIKSATATMFLAAMLWTAIEFYRSELFVLRFPWITPGSALGPTFLSPIVGVYGMSFLVIAASAGFLRRRTLAPAIGLSLCIIALGLFGPALVEPDDQASVTVTVVQSEECALASYVELTRKAQTDAPDLIVWPEYALPYDVRAYPNDFKTLTDLCAEMDAVLVVGTQTVVGPGPTDWHNTALVLDQRGVLGEYYKSRPVHFFNDGIPGRQPNLIQTDLGTFGTPICFDCDYTDVAQTMAARGAEYFIVPSFDAKSWSADQHLQHALLFRLRAAETGRWLACAASSGVSQIIDPHGNAQGSLPPMATGVLTRRIEKGSHTTFFVRVGWLFPWLTLGGSAVAVAFGLIRFVAGRKQRTHPTHDA